METHRFRLIRSARILLATRCCVTDGVAQPQSLPIAKLRRALEVTPGFLLEIIDDPPKPKGRPKRKGKT